MLPFALFYDPYNNCLTFPTYYCPFFPQNLVPQLSYYPKEDEDKSFELKKQEEPFDNERLLSTQQNCKAQAQKRTVKTESTVKLKLQTGKSLQHKTAQNSKEKKQKQQRQIEGRNANSNLLRMFFRSLEQVLQSSPQLIHHIIIKNKMKITSAKFMEWFEINKAQYTNYIRLPCIKKLFICNRVNRSGKFQTKIMRILLGNFLRNEALCFYLTSKKIKRAGMSYNYRSIRNILKQIAEEQNDL